MNRLKLLLGCVLVGILVAVVYYGFETAVHHSISYVWDSLFDSATTRILVIPLCIVGGLIFFGLQHVLDPASENHEEHGLGGGVMTPTFKQLLIVLVIGYFSLLAGASLGPEAILVPSSVIIGALLGTKLLRKNDIAPKVLAAAGIMALMAAFFHSFIIGLLSVLLVTKQTKAKLSPNLIIVGILASASSTITLKMIDPTNKYFNFPDVSWKVAIIDLLFGVVLIIGGYFATFGLKYAHRLVADFRVKARRTAWWQQAILASVGLSILYLLGGTLVQFTGNESIAPLLQQASSLGFMGLIWILIIKILVIGWSKAMGYRGGLVFPMIFVASTLVAIAQLVNSDVNFLVGLVATMVGVLAAEKKAKILF